ncbi:hypothetical protein [Bartonella ancashensis]|uniref:Putative genomic island protein n=1 Tax=Bartonella ancashensis TaxID=1318743 RepID=A0A0M5KZ84_9HYPH|nr:hypothetical protein [Bartonella ancashensis]ALE03428.1 putative genomic island protein [Bartonella ancashensis]ALE03494.1 putative genomic island protein [Bartonella ancashensis]
MEIVKRLFSKNNKPQKRFVATAIGHVPWGLGSAEYFYNLYECEDGTREFEAFEGYQFYDVPKKADFSTKAQVKARMYGGSIPKTILNIEPLIEEINKDIKRYSAG